MNCDNCVIYDSTNPCGKKNNSLQHVTNNCVFLGKVVKFRNVSLNEIKEWLFENCDGKFSFSQSKKGVKFESKADATLFKLRWG